MPILNYIGLQVLCFVFTQYIIGVLLLAIPIDIGSVAFTILTLMGMLLATASFRYKYPTIKPNKWELILLVPLILVSILSGENNTTALDITNKSGDYYASTITQVHIIDEDTIKAKLPLYTLHTPSQFILNDTYVKTYLVQENHSTLITVSATDTEPKYLNLPNPVAYTKTQASRKILALNPTKQLGTPTFEVSDDLTPYWIFPSIKENTIEGIYLFDTSFDKIYYHSIDNIPKWVDNVYPPNYILETLSANIDGNISQDYHFVNVPEGIRLCTSVIDKGDSTKSTSFLTVNTKTLKTTQYKVTGVTPKYVKESLTTQHQVAYPSTLVNEGGRLTYFNICKQNSTSNLVYSLTDVVNPSKSITHTDLSQLRELYSMMTFKTKSPIQNLPSLTITVKSTEFFELDGKSICKVVDTLGDSYFITVKDNIEILYLYPESTITLTRGVDLLENLDMKFWNLVQ